MPDKELITRLQALHAEGKIPKLNGPARILAARVNAACERAEARKESHEDAIRGSRSGGS